jgi:acetyltransferase-like isoleucine patch superfamily enzyme
MAVVQATEPMSFRLTKLLPFRRILIGLMRFLYCRVCGMDLHPTCQFSTTTKFDLTNPKGVHVGEQSYVAFGVTILTHDYTRGIRRHTRIGRWCFIGCRSIILPGITIGDGSIVGAGAVVVKDVPPRCIVAGNPAKIIRSDIEVGPFGRFPDATETQRREMKEFGLD